MRKGFTLLEMVVVLAVVSILAAILVPTVAKNIKDAKIARANNETLVISAAIMTLYKDTGKLPFTNTNGPAGGVSRVLSGETTSPVPSGTATGARTGAANWGSLGPVKQLYDYLYYNNSDDDTGATNSNQSGQDYPTTGEFAWRGPYIDKRVYLDPWGNQYVVSARYFAGNPLVATTTGHQVLVLCAGPDQLWSTAFSDAVTRFTTPDDSPYSDAPHDDIGIVTYTNN
jgi:prepilin-type N-terminal cleavage/methylation domain-containing protein